MQNKFKRQFKNNIDKPDNIHKGKPCIMLAHGESGNAHAFYGEDTVEYNPKTGKLLVKKEDDLAHEEHKAQTVAPIAPDKPAEADVTYQREYSMGIIRQTID